MKNAKKILLLVLSLVLLIGVFAVTAFAEEEAPAATVVYPDGTTETFALGETIAGKEFVTEGDAKLYYGDGNTLFKMIGTDWTFTVEGESAPLTELTVTDAMLGKKIIAGGFDKVYYTTTVDGVTTYVTTNNLGTYLSKMDYNVKIKMYADHETSTRTVSGRYSMDTYVGSDGKTYYVAMNARYDLDINGHKLTVKGGTITCFASAFYVYSTKPGAEYHIEGGSTMFYTNNDDYKFIDGTYYGNKTTQYKNSPLTENKPTGFIIIGENAEPKTNVKGPYGDNLTIYGQSLTGALYGNTVRVWGGNFVQTGTQAVFSNFTNRTVYFYHATFVLTNSTTAFMYQNTANYTYNNCTVIYAGEGTAQLFAVQNPTNSGSTNADKHTKYSTQTFNNCNFYNVMPGMQYTYNYTYNYVVDKVTKKTYTGEDIFRAAYNNCSFGYSDTATAEDLDAADSTVAYLAYIANGKTVTVNGVKYLLNMQLVEDASKLKTITWPGNEKNYYLASDATVVEGIVKAIPKYQTYLVSYEFAGENNTLFYVETPDIVVSVGEDLCATLVDETVPQKVYYTVETAEGKTYFFNADTYAKEITAILNDPIVQKTVMLYENLSMHATYVYTPKAAPQAIYFDLNGHTWTLTSNYNGFGLDISGTIYIYSTAPGAEVRVPEAGALFRTNDKTPTNKTQGIGRAYFGEPNGTSTEYGKNITFYCNVLNGDMYQTSAYIYGGIFVQNKSSTSKYLTLMSREKDPDGHFQVIKNATFVVTKAGSSPLYWSHTSNNGRTFTNCTFISTAGDYVPLLATYVSGMNNEAIGTPTFDNCYFYNIIPQRNIQYTRKDGAIGTVTPVYKNNCRFGFSNLVPAEAPQATEASALYLIRGAETTTISVLGVDYVLDTYVSSTPAVLVTWKNLADEDILEYYEADLAPIAPTHIAEWYDFGRGCKWIGVLSFEKNEITDGDTVTAIDMIAVWETQEKWAFTYLVNGELVFVNLSDCGDTEEGVGEKFYELFDKLDNTYVVTLYHDLLLTKGMGMGTLGSVSKQDGTLVPHYNSLSLGNFTLDLNGKTFSTSSTFAFVDGSNVDSYGENSGGVFCFETNASNTFKILSSKSGARFEHNDICSIFCIGEGASCHLVIEGENITFDSMGPITHAFEMSTTYADITINGGTYIYRGNTIAFSINGNGNGSSAVAPTITNAEIVLTHEKAVAVFGMHRYKRHTNLTVTNTKIHSLHPVKLFSIINNNLNSSSPEDSAYNYYLTLDGCTVSGVVLENAYTHLDQLTYTGTMFATDETSLLNAYMDAAPEGNVATYKSDTIAGYDVKVLGYYLSAETATIDWGFGLTENWLIGSKATHENTIIDGRFGYTFNSFIVGEGSPVATLVAINPHMMTMSLTLHSQIGLNLMLTKDALIDAVVTLNGETYNLADLTDTNGIYKITAAIAPNVANEAIDLVIVFNGYTHTIPISIATYAEAILKSTTDEHKAAHNLTYAMVEYVRAMTGDEDFCNVTIPDDYRQTLVAKEYTKTEGNELLSGIRFNLSGTIAIEVAGVDSDTKGKEVVLILPLRQVKAVIQETTNESGKTVYTAVFEDLYVNEFYGDLTIMIEGEEYTYSLANYLASMKENADKTVVQALYNYAYYAQAYVDALPKNA